MASPIDSSFEHEIIGDPNPPNEFSSHGAHPRHNNDCFVRKILEVSEFKIFNPSLRQF